MLLLGNDNNGSAEGNQHYLGNHAIASFLPCTLFIITTLVSMFQLCQHESPMKGKEEAAVVAALATLNNEVYKMLKLIKALKAD